MKKLSKNKFLLKWSLFIIMVISATALGFLISINAIFGLGMALGLLLVLLIATNFRLGIILVLISILPGQLIRVPIPGTEYGAILLSDILIMILVLSWLLSHLLDILRSKNKLPANPINVTIILFLSVALISLINGSRYLSGNEILSSTFYLGRLMGYTALYFVVLDQIREKEDIKKYIGWVIGVGLVFAFIGFGQFILFPNFYDMWLRYGWDPHVQRLLGTFFDPNFAGGFIVIILSLIIALYLSLQSPRKKIFLAAAGSVLFLALILTYSRSSLLAFGVVLVVIALLRSPKLFFGGLLIAIIIFISFPRLTTRIQSGFSIDKNVKDRLNSWKNAWTIIEDHPWLGVGYNSFNYAQIEYGLVAQAKNIQTTGLPQSLAGSDSSLLTVWATTGIIGLISYLAIYILIICQSWMIYFNRRLSPSLRGFSLGILALSLGILIHSQFVNSLLYPFIMIIIWVVFGIFVRWQNLEKLKIEK